MLAALEHNVNEFGVRFLHLDSGKQGIVHVIGPELGLSQPGMTIACGDSHTSTHGAMGSSGFRHRHDRGGPRAGKRRPWRLNRMKVKAHRGDGGTPLRRQRPRT